MNKEKKQFAFKHTKLASITYAVLAFALLLTGMGDHFSERAHRTDNDP